ncbi:MAG: hypothetical protein J7M24_07365 [Candidatus Latescibacteria bacterium]|nr:hypothetical protein [Candidatus Latescibacterota bacterium]
MSNRRLDVETHVKQDVIHETLWNDVVRLARKNKDFKENLAALGLIPKTF